MAIDYNAIVPIPIGANIPRRSGGRVFIVTAKRYNVDKQYNTDERISIGCSIDQERMHPNSNYKILFPEEFNAHVPYARQLPALTKIIGPYASFLAVGQQTRLYPILIESVGPQNANMVMDYGMYSILTHSNVARDFQNTMQAHLLFSKRAYSDSWLSEFFKVKLTEEQGQLFLDNWLLHCKENGLTAVWLCIDGSNNDCDAENVFDAELGYDKSCNGGPIVSYMWAVSSKDGTPVTFRVYRGARVDATALKEIISYLASFRITVLGVILDRGFWCKEDVECLQEAGLDFLIMMKGGRGFSEMLKSHGNQLRDGDISLMLKQSGEYGVVDEVEVFGSSDMKLHVCLLYNNVRAAKSVNALTDKVKEAIADAKAKVTENMPYTISGAVSHYIKIQKFRGRKKDVISIDEKKLKDAVDGLGFAALASSKEMTAQDVYDIYALRQFSEKQYAIFKSQLGYDVLRVYASDSWLSKFACGFIAGILRNGFETRCSRARIDANAALRELCHIRMFRIRDDMYIYIRMMSIKARTVLAEHGLIEDDMSLIAEAENKRISGESIDPVHTLPVRETTRRKPGRPKGSKNKKPRTKNATKSKKS